MELTGNSLGERHRDLNSKVNDAAARNVTLEDLNVEEDSSDVKILFNIGLASKNRNISYIIKMLKSGDGLYALKAMKCQWLYDAEHQDFINPYYLHNNVFPFMALKMRKKFLTTISMYLRDESRSIDFFEYCVDENLPHHAFKFLFHTSIGYKTNVIEKKFSLIFEMNARHMKYYRKNNYNIQPQRDSTLLQLVGNNFDLAELYQEKAYNKKNMPYNWSYFRHLYFVDAERYLDKLEIYINCDLNCIPSLGLRISKDIMLKHKKRIIKNIQLYYKAINKSMFIKYTTIDDAKLYLTTLLPESSNDFWSYKYENFFKALLDLIPSEERFEFFKGIFETKYPNHDFEMSEDFYRYGFYEIMTAEQREEWALRYLAGPNKSFLSQNDDYEYLWYQYVNFDDALTGIKKHILTASDASKRKHMLSLLTKRTKNQEHVQKLLQYYYERHVNEDTSNKLDFLHDIKNNSPVWKFNKDCWEFFNKLLHSIEVYNPEDVDYNIVRMFRFIALFYHILNENNVSEELQYFIESGEIFCFDIIESLLNKLTHEEQQLIYAYLEQLCVDKIRSWYDINSGDKPEEPTQKYPSTDFIRKLQKFYNKSNDDLPEIILKYFESVSGGRLEESFKLGPILLKLLNQDAKLVISKIPLLKGNVSKENRIGTFLKKIKVYFSNDLIHDFVNNFKQSLSRNIECENFQKMDLLSAVLGIFVLADESDKNDLLIRFAPTQPKIAHRQIDRKYLFIQKAICRFACYSRPPVSFENICMYIKGDYVRFFTPVFDMYASNLPPLDFEQFVIALFDGPESVKKYSLRLAVQNLKFESLKNIVLLIWKKSESIEQRMVIYTNLYKKMLSMNDEKQLELFQILINITTELNEDDHRDIFYILTDDGDNLMPDHLKSAFYETVWITVSRFPDYDKHIDQKCDIIQNIINNIHVIDHNILRKFVDDYLDDMFIKKRILPTKLYRKFFERLNEKMFRLTAAFIVAHDDEEHLKSSQKILQFILNKCLEMWDVSFKLDPEDDVEYHCSRFYCWDFVRCLKMYHFQLRTENYTANNVIFEKILDNFQGGIPADQAYLHVWDLRMLLITNVVLDRQHDDGREIIRIFSSEIVKVVKEYVNQNQFHLSFVNDISGILVDYIPLLVNKIQVSEDYVNDNAVRILVASEFIRYDVEELDLMCTRILPSTVKYREHARVVENLIRSKSNEVKVNIHFKTLN